MAETAPPVLDVQALRVTFRTRSGPVHAVNDVSFALAQGEVLGVVGESGSGKSVTMMALLGLLPADSATVTARALTIAGEDVRAADPAALRRLRGGKVGFVFQDPMTSLNPVFTVGFQIMEPLRAHMGLTRRQAATRAAELLDLVGIPDARRRLRDYPHQFSGGMRQRVMIAIALACSPRLLIADEPTTALDVTIQAQIIELMADLRRQMGMAVIWITHDLGVVSEMADRVMVMYGGQVVESARAPDLFARPGHPYTRALLGTMPRAEGARPARLTVIEGQPPILMAPPAACSFRDRCPVVFDACHRLNPQPYPVSRRGHDVSCLRADPGMAALAPQVAHG